MPAYRIYHVDGVGRFSTADWIEAPDDSAALTAAGKRRVAAEVWQGSRFVGRIEAETKKKAS